MTLNLGMVWKHLFNWINSDKISLNIKKREKKDMIIFKYKRKRFVGNVNESVKYLRIEIDKISVGSII